MILIPFDFFCKQFGKKGEMSFKTFGANDQNETYKNYLMFQPKNTFTDVTFCYMMSTLSLCPNVHDMVTLLISSHNCFRCSQLSQVFIIVKGGLINHILSHLSNLVTLVI